jgi:hypothetical protein
MATITIPGLPAGKCCLWQLDKVAAGTRKASPPPQPYDCETGATWRHNIVIQLTLKSTRSNCDQLVEQIPDGSVLTAKGRMILRKGGLAVFSGEFSLRSDKDKLLFKGVIELMDRVGTHHTFSECEACDEKSHLEGWLAGSDESSGHTLRAMLGLKGLTPSASEAKRLSGIINGVVIRCS